MATEAGQAVERLGVIWKCEKNRKNQKPHLSSEQIKSAEVHTRILETQKIA